MVLPSLFLGLFNVNNLLRIGPMWSVDKEDDPCCSGGAGKNDDTQWCRRLVLWCRKTNLVNEVER